MAGRFLGAGRGATRRGRAAGRFATCFLDANVLCCLEIAAFAVPCLGRATGVPFLTLRCFLNSTDFLEGVRAATFPRRVTTGPFTGRGCVLALAGRAGETTDFCRAFLVLTTFLGGRARTARDDGRLSAALRPDGLVVSRRAATPRSPALLVPFLRALSALGRSRF